MRALALYAEESVVVEPNGKDMAPIQVACRRSGVAICLGVSERMAGGHTLFSSQVVVDAEGSIRGVHRKLQPTFAERLVWAQGDGSSLAVWPLRSGGNVGPSFNLGGLICWEHAMDGARQALVAQHETVHAAAWPALMAVPGFERAGNAQVEALVRAHALAAQAFVVAAGSFVDNACLTWMRDTLGEQNLVRPGGGWSAIVHPFCFHIAGPHTAADERLVQAVIDKQDLSEVKVWIDSAGHHGRPEILQFGFDDRPHWPDEKKADWFQGRAMQGQAAGAADVETMKIAEVKKPEGKKGEVPRRGAWEVVLR